MSLILIMYRVELITVLVKLVPSAIPAVLVTRFKIAVAIVVSSPLRSLILWEIVDKCCHHCGCVEVAETPKSLTLLRPKLWWQIVF